MRGPFAVLTKLAGKAIQPTFDLGELAERASQHHLEGGGGRRPPGQLLRGGAQRLPAVTDPVRGHGQLAGQLLDPGAIPQLHGSMLAAPAAIAERRNDTVDPTASCGQRHYRPAGHAPDAGGRRAAMVE